MSDTTECKWNLQGFTHTDLDLTANWIDDGGCRNISYTQPIEDWAEVWGRLGDAIQEMQRQRRKVINWYLADFALMFALNELEAHLVWSELGHVLDEAKNTPGP